MYAQHVLKLPYKELKIWQKGMELAKTTYALTKVFPEEERYGLVSQMRRAAVSIPSNIAEGSQRTTNKDFRSFIAIAKGSLAELETQAVLSVELKFLCGDQAKTYFAHLEELSKMLRAFSAKL